MTATSRRLPTVRVKRAEMFDKISLQKNPAPSRFSPTNKAPAGLVAQDGRRHMQEDSRLLEVKGAVAITHRPVPCDRPVPLGIRPDHQAESRDHSPRAGSK